MAPCRPKVCPSATKKASVKASVKTTKKIIAKQPKKQPKKQFTKSAKMESTEADFPLFSLLPAEIQSKIFTEALCKPQVHWMRAEDYDISPADRWGLRFTKRNAGGDASGFSLSRRIYQVSPVAANAVRLATAEKARLPFYTTPMTRIMGNMDASTDLVCVEFGKGRTGWRYNNWSRRTQVFLPRRFDRQASVDQNGGIRRLGIVYNQGVTRTTPDLTRVFKCAVRHTYQRDQNGLLLLCDVCPIEVVGFLDTFPDLEGVYIIVRQGNIKISKEKSRVYKNSFFAIPKQEREEKNLEVFHDMRFSYIEIRPEMATNILPRTALPPHARPRLEQQITEAFDLIRDIRTEFLTSRLGAQFTMNREKRQKLKITALLETPRV